jgi:hypothetical protein
MNDENDYESIGDTSWDDIPVVKTLPKGPWLLQGKNAKRMKGREGDDEHEASSPYVLFFYKAVEPLADVDDDELAALGEDYDTANNDLSFRIYIESKVDYRKVLTHLAKHGIVPEKDEATGKMESIDATLKRFRKSKVIGTLGQRTFKDKTGELRTDNTISAFYSETEDDAQS